MPHRYSQLHIALALTIACLAAAPGIAEAQTGQPGGLPTAPTPPETKPEGVAEQAPKTPGVLPTTPVLPPPKSRRKKLHVFSLDGYFRLRGDWFKNFSLGFDDNPADGSSGAPFPRPLACREGTANARCRNTIKTSNIRLRLEPTVNISERAAVHMQVDVLDNVVLGSTPLGAFGDPNDPRAAQVGIVSGGQDAPEAGRNSSRDSIVVKRAWGDVRTPLGRLKFGRMPAQWGMGLLENSGNKDPQTGAYDLDSDYGDTVDRLYFSTIIPGTSFRGAMALDWGASRPSSDQFGLFRTGAAGVPTDNRQQNQPFDLDDTDDVNQWLFVISRIDAEKEFRDKVRNGEFAVNYGAYFAWREQGFEQADFVVGADPATGVTADMFTRRGATMYIPDGWLKAAYGALEFELELVGVFGKVNAINKLNSEGTPVAIEDIKIRQFGGLARLGYTLLDGDLKFEGEVGYASGDQFDNDPAGATHISNRPFPPRLLESGDTFRAFQFDPNHRVDMILFRELIGAVTNATYVRPSVMYKLTDKIALRGTTIVSFANEEVSTPGNSRMYGVEFNADIGYESDTFAAGIAYGVLFPLAALNHPADLRKQGPGNGANFEFVNNTGDADTAQTIQTRFVLKF